MHPSFPARLFCVLCSSVLLLLGNMGFASPEEPPGIEVVIDKKPVDQSQKEILVPVSSRSLLFNIGNEPRGRNPNARRVRYKLEGADQDWIEQQNGSVHHGIEMAICFRFLDAAGKVVGVPFFTFTGKSPGWKETPEDSVFTPQQERVRVPPTANGLMVVINSSGPASAMGVLLLKDIEITWHPSDKPDPEILFRSSQPLQSGGAGGEQTPRDWTRDGGRSSMSRIVSFGGGQPMGLWHF